MAAEATAISLEDDINSHLANLYGIPDFLSKTHRVRDAVTVPFNLTNYSTEDKKILWLKNSKLLDLDNFLELAAKDFFLDQIFVLNSNGDCIGSSLWRMESSCIGVNFSERVFFSENKNGLRGMQYAMGKTTHKGGIFFAVPVQADGKFKGSVVAKYNVENLASIFKSKDGLILDNNQVIIYSSYPNTQLKTFSSDLKSRLSDTEIGNIYQTNDIPKITIHKWEEDSSLPLVKINTISKTHPFLLFQRKVEKWNLTIVVTEPFDEVNSLSRKRNYFFIMLTILGGALILIFTIAKELTIREYQ